MSPTVPIIVFCQPHGPRWRKNGLRCLRAIRQEPKPLFAGHWDRSMARVGWWVSSGSISVLVGFPLDFWSEIGRTCWDAGLKSLDPIRFVHKMSKAGFKARKKRCMDCYSLSFRRLRLPIPRSTCWTTWVFLTSRKTWNALCQPWTSWKRMERFHRRSSWRSLAAWAAGGWAVD